MELCFKNASERIFIDLGIKQANNFINKKLNYIIDDNIISSIDFDLNLDISNTISNTIIDNSNIIIDNSDIKIN